MSFLPWGTRGSSRLVRAEWTRMTYYKFADYWPILSDGFAESRDRLVKNVAAHSVRASSYGLVRASVDVVAGLPDEYAQGIYAQPHTFPAVLRFSDGLGRIRPGVGFGAVCGVGVKMFDVPGRSLTKDGPDAGTFDLELINSPTFFCNTARDYVAFEALCAELPEVLLAEADRRDWFYRFVTGDGTLPRGDWLWDELFSFVTLESIPHKNLLSYDYWSIGALRHGDYIAKVRLRPAEVSSRSVDHEAGTGTAAESFRAGLVEEAGEREHRFDLQVQLAVALSRTPVHNTSKRWSEQDSPFVTVARILVPRQDISMDANLVSADATMITPWRSREEHRPLGEIMELGRSVCVHDQFGCPKGGEPGNVEELMGCGSRSSEWSW
ncbi:hypothetical protein ACIRG5_25015 [Lentzea sp. NPDC102401]|uniref:hypothetical protein n=1 Tax=Lentzea sp. NPDC102401 TaxID=3364128 RepID=UPI0037FA40B4